MKKPNLKLTPEGFKEDTIFAQIPESGAGDFTFTRAGVANRVNSGGTIEEMGTNVPRLDYSDGGCSALLFEPQRTNLFLNSDTPVTQSITVVNGSVYTVSCFASVSVVLSNAGSGTVTEGNEVTFTASSTTLLCTVSGVDANSKVQVEEGGYPTSYIKTEGSQVTRSADATTTKNVSSFVTATSGAMMVDIESVLGDRDKDSIIFILGSTNGRIYITGSDVNLDIVIQSSDGSNNVYNLTKRSKVLFNWSATNVDIWVDGVKALSTGKAFSLTNTDLLIKGNGKLLNIYKLGLWNTTLSDLEAAEETRVDIIKLITGGTIVESPTDTFTVKTSAEQELATGLDNIVIGINTGGSFTADLIFNFLGSASASDFSNDTEWINIGGNYEIKTSTLTEAVDSQILDILTFSNGNELNDFVNELRTNFILQIKLK